MDNHDDNAVAVDGLTKRYGDRVAVDGISFTIPRGEIVGLIGPNGAGKTTIMAMLLGLVRPSSGTGSVLGAALSHPGAYLPRVGSLIEAPAFHPGVSARRNLCSIATLARHPTDTIDELLDLVGLTGRGDDRYAAYSLGMKQRLGIAASLLGDPDLVILDEPTNGLDPAGMQDIRRIITTIGTGGRTVLVSSHLLGELEQTCTWLIALDRGGIVHLGPPADLGAGVDEVVARPCDPDDGDTVVALAVALSPGAALGADGAVHLPVPAGADPAGLAAALNSHCHDHGIVLCQLQHQSADLEQRYLTLVGASA